jgi:hypothetical protein
LFEGLFAGMNKDEILIQFLKDRTQSCALVWPVIHQQNIQFSRRIHRRNIGMESSQPQPVGCDLTQKLATFFSEQNNAPHSPQCPQSSHRPQSIPVVAPRKAIQDIPDAGLGKHHHVKLVVFC